MAVFKVQRTNKSSVICPFDMNLCRTVVDLLVSTAKQLWKNLLSRRPTIRRFIRRKICLSRLHIRRFVRPLCASGQSLESPRGCLTRSSNLLITCGLFAPKFFLRSGLLNCIFEITIAFKGGIKQAASPNFFHLSPSCVLFHGNPTEPAQAFRGKA